MNQCHPMSGKKTRTGYLTVVYVDGVEFSIFCRTKESLAYCFTTVTGGRIIFDTDKIDHVEIHKSRQQKAREAHQ